MLQVLRTLLWEKIKDIDSGNSYISEKDQEDLINIFQKISFPYLSKIEAARYIGVSRPTFEKYVNKGLIPQGEKRSGLPLLWSIKDLDNYLKNKK